MDFSLYDPYLFEISSCSFFLPPLDPYIDPHEQAKGIPILSFQNLQMNFCIRKVMDPLQYLPMIKNAFKLNTMNYYKNIQYLDVIAIPEVSSIFNFIHNQIFHLPIPPNLLFFCFFEKDVDLYLSSHLLVRLALFYHSFASFLPSLQKSSISSHCSLSPIYCEIPMMKLFYKVFSFQIHLLNDLYQYEHMSFLKPTTLQSNEFLNDFEAYLDCYSQYKLHQDAFPPPDSLVLSIQMIHGHCVWGSSFKDVLCSFHSLVLQSLYQNISPCMNPTEQTPTITTIKKNLSSKTVYIPCYTRNLLILRHHISTPTPYKETTIHFSQYPNIITYQKNIFNTTPLIKKLFGQNFASIIDQLSVEETPLHEVHPTTFGQLPLANGFYYNMDVETSTIFINLDDILVFDTLYQIYTICSLFQLVKGTLVGILLSDEEHP